MTHPKGFLSIDYNMAKIQKNLFGVALAFFYIGFDALPN